MSSNEHLRKALKLYVIPDRRAGQPLSIEEQTKRALIGGATMIQLRDKEMSGRELYDTALRLIALCRPSGVPLIINDRFDIALAAGADGVHLGAQDLPLCAVKKLAPRKFIIGATAHSVEEGVEAEKDGADYIGIGAVFPSLTKNTVSVLGLEGIRAISSSVLIPTVTIGGIDIENVANVMGSGVDGAAVVAAVIGQKDISSAASLLAEKIFNLSYE